MNNDIPVPVIIGLMLLTGIFAWTGGSAHGRNDAREKAVQAGVAYWQIDPKTGDRTFVYGVPK